MENNTYHVPFYVVTGGIKLSGHSSELSGGAVGLYDRNTWSVATAIGNGKEFFFAQGNIGGKDWYGQPISETHKSPFFMGKDVVNMYVSRPQTIQNEEWVIGFNGSPSSKGLIFEKGKAVRIKLLFHGDPAYRFFGGPKEYVVSYTPLVDCTAPCNGSDCPEAIVDCLTHTQALIDNINTHTELVKFGVRAKLVNTPYTAGTVNMEKYSLSIIDNGTSIDLQAVQAQYPLLKVSRISRVGATSVYNFCQPNAAAAPADFTQSGSVSLAVCGVCPAGSTFAGGTDTYFISRPIIGGEDFSGNGSVAAAAVATAYSTVVTFDGASAVEVVAASDAITIPTHKFSTGQKVTYANGGGTTVVGLTSATDYYVIKASPSTIKLATSAVNAYAGTAIAIADGAGAGHTLTTKAISSSLVSNSGGNYLVKVIVPVGDPLVQLSGDTVTFGFSTEQTCTFTAPTPISWTQDAIGGISSRRTMRINGLNRPDCNNLGTDRLADVASILAGVQGVDLTTLTLIPGVSCADDYTVQQDSIDCLDESCLTNNVTFNYDSLPAFESRAWEVVPVVPTEDATRKCGIRITAGYYDPKFGNCSFDVTDFYETQPIKMEVSLLVEDGSNCDFALFPSQLQTKIGRPSRQTGEWVVREVIMKTAAYLKHMMQYSNDPRMREAFDQNLLGMVDRNAYYDLYYVSFGASYGIPSYRKNEQEKFTAVFAFKAGDPAALTFQSNVIDVLTAKSGVTLHVNS